MNDASHLSRPELETGLESIRQSPRDGGVLNLIVRRPRPGEREVLETGRLTFADGLEGDCWKVSTYGPDGSAHPDMQVTVMNARAIALLAGDRSRWALAGDQLYVDLDLSVDNLPPGTRLAIGSAIIEVTAEPHTGCRQFSVRYGKDATRFVNSPEGKHLRLRGLNAKVVEAGVIRVGDQIAKLPRAGD